MKRRLVHALMLASLAVGVTPCVAAAHHGRSSSSHHHGKAKPKQGKKAHGGPSAPAGATNVPAGGLKVYCSGSRSPLLVRKFTQGSGTMVTVLCR